MSLEEKRAQLEALQSEIQALEATEEPEDLSYQITDPEAQRTFIKNLPTVAKAKGLPEVNGGIVKMFTKAAIVRQAPEKNEQSLILSKARTKMPRKSEDYRPSPEQLAKINNLSNTDLKADDVYVFPMKCCDQLVDRSMDHFSSKALNSISKLQIDKPQQKDHSHSVNDSFGKTFDSKVYNKAVQAEFYTLDTPEYESINNKILSGIVNKVSVGFGMNPADYVCDSCNKSMYSMDCKHWPGMLDEKGNQVTVTIKDVVDYYETSVVAVPAQPAAGIRRNDSFEPEEGQVKNNDVGRIINDKSSDEGDRSVTTPNPVVNPPEVTAPEAPVVAPAEKAVEATPPAEAVVTPPADVTPPAAQPAEAVPAPENEVVKAFTAALEKFNASTEKLTSAIEASVASSKANEEILKSVVASVDAQAKVIADATKSTVETTVKSAPVAETTPALQGATGSGSILNFLVKSLETKSAQ